MEELDWEGSDDEHPVQEAPHEEAGDDEGLDGLDGTGSGQAAGQPQQVQRAGSMTPPGSPDRARDAANGAAPTTAATAATTTAAATANGDAVPEEWQVMDIPEEWRPRPMVRVWGLPAVTQEEELAQLLEATLAEQGASVRSVVFDPRQATAAGKVALVRFEPPSLPEEGAAEPDAGKVAEKLIAALRAAAPQLHGTKINVEKTGAEVRQAGRLQEGRWHALQRGAAPLLPAHCLREAPRPWATCAATWSCEPAACKAGLHLCSQLSSSRSLPQVLATRPPPHAHTHTPSPPLALPGLPLSVQPAG